MKATIIRLLLIPVANAALMFYPFEPIVPCADGSPAGFYTNYNDEKEENHAWIDKTKHLIVFEGGGACKNLDDCKTEYLSEPYKFSSEFLPQSIQGDTILSENDKQGNPFKKYSKMFVPYCTQDLFLGDINKGNIGDFVHGGSAIFKRAITTWRDRVTEDIVDDVEILVVVGISAGAIGVMNHVKTIQGATRAANVAELKIVFDAASISDQQDGKNDLSVAMETYVNLTEHPMCNFSNSLSQLYNREVSDLPCCLSLHCMLRHDKDVALLTASTANNTGFNPSPSNTTLVFLDSLYDPLVQTTLRPAPKVGQANGFTNVMNNIWYGSEMAGSRLVRSMETSAILTSRHQQNPSSQQPSRPKIYWLLSSCVTHGFFVPSIELLHLRCLRGNFKDKDPIFVCNKDGAGLKSKIQQVGIDVTLWQPVNTWDYAHVQGISVKEILTSFVSPDKTFLANETEEVYAFNVLADDCNGPNCALPDSTPNQCQALFELDTNSVPIPFRMKLIWFIVFTLIVLSIGLRFCSSEMFSVLQQKKIMTTEQTWDDDVQHILESIKQKASSFGQTRGCQYHQAIICSVNNLCISAGPKGINILSNVDLEIYSSSITGLLGRSGSGKSTLLKALSMQKLGSLHICSGSIANHCPSHRIAYLRQSDSVKLDNMNASEYLVKTALLYGSDSQRVSDCTFFVKMLFARGESSDLDPFNEVKIKNLSGGQRRILALATTLLLTPKVVLLDEPLSGLDDASSLLVMKFVRILSIKYSCAIVLSLHNPSKAIFEFLDRAIIFDSGKVKIETSRSKVDEDNFMGLHSQLGELMSGFLDKSVRNLQIDKESDPEQGTIAETSFKVEVATEADECESRRLKEKKNSESHLELQDHTSAPPLDQQVFQSMSSNTSTPQLQNFNDDLHRSKILTLMGSASRVLKRVLIIRQVPFICQRLQANYGSDPIDLATLPIILMLFAMVLRFDNGSPVQEVIVSTFLIGIPLNLFRHKVHLTCKMWTAHRPELDDKRISLISYQLASQTFTFAIPTFSLILSHILSYSILGWSFESLPVQILFSGVHLLVNLQFGRALCTHYSGDYRKFSKFYSVYIFLSFLFGGLLVPARKMPSWLSWLYPLSTTFWAISGAALNVLQFRDQSGYCVDAVSCILSDGSFIAYYRGFSPYSTEFLALGTLTAWFVALCIAEYVLLNLRCASTSSSRKDKGKSRNSKQEERNSILITT